VRAFVLLTLASTCGVSAASNSARAYELVGQVAPEAQASVSLFGATFPFSATTLTDARGRFRFEKLQPGAYTVAAFVPGRGEARTTVEVGPAAADSRGRVEMILRMDEAKLWPDRGPVVSTRELSIPPGAWKQYAQAQKKLARHDTQGAIALLKRAVEAAPQFAAAWNNLGTIAYQTKAYPDAEKYFRRALEADPAAYEPLVNLGGVLLTLGKVEEAYNFNLYSVLKRPNDALANSQLGMNYFALGKMDLAEKYLLEAVRLDPAHFSHPQLLLAEIYLHRNDRTRAAAQLEDFLNRHPDWPSADQMRAVIAKLRKEASAGRQ
jgi:tetratricopeptide (TPR) repeat protein